LALRQQPSPHRVTRSQIYFIVIRNRGGCMPQKKTVFAEHYEIQESWIRRQIEHSKEDSFINQSLALKEIDEAGIAAFASPYDVDKFRDKHLSESGKRKLSSTLRTFKKRQNKMLTTQRLDIDISQPAYLALEAITREQKVTKIKLIERLLLEEKTRSENNL